MSGQRQPLQNILWLVGERVGRATVTVTVLGLLARYLEPAGFGRLNLAITLVAIAASLATFGLEGVVVSELIRRPDQAGAVLGTASRLRLLGGLVACALLNAICWCVGPLREDTLLIAAISLGLLIQPVEVFDLWFQRHLDSRRTVIARFVGVAAGATLKLWLVARHAPLAAFAWAQLADVVFIALSLLWVGYRSPYRSGSWRWDPEIARVLWRRGAPLAGSAVIMVFAIRLDQLLVRTVLGEQPAGIYLASSRLIDLAVFTGASICLSLFPALSDSHLRSDAAYRDRLQNLFSLLSALGWAVVLGCTLAGPWIIRWLYGAAYAEAARVLAIQSWACLIGLNAAARANFIILSAPPLVNLAVAGLHIACFAILARLLLVRWGLPGAAFTLLGANLASGVIATWIFPSLRSCAGPQLRGFLIPFRPARWRELLRPFQS